MSENALSPPNIQTIRNAVQLALENRWNRMVAWRDGKVSDVPMADVAMGPRLVDPTSDLVASARGVGIVFGDENPDQELRE